MPARVLAAPVMTKPKQNNEDRNRQHDLKHFLHENIDIFPSEIMIKYMTCISVIYTVFA